MVKRATLSYRNYELHRLPKIMHLPQPLQEVSPIFGRQPRLSVPYRCDGYTQQMKSPWMPGELGRVFITFLPPSRRGVATVRIQVPVRCEILFGEMHVVPKKGGLKSRKGPSPHVGEGGISAFRCQTYKNTSISHLACICAALATVRPYHTCRAAFLSHWLAHVQHQCAACLTHSSHE